jgi:signal transduction histidine kinase
MQGNRELETNQKDSRFSDVLPFLVTASHELKAPLALVRQLALALEDSMESDEEKQVVRRILLTSERALRLTTDLTRSTRLEDSLFELEPLNPYQICEEVAHEITPLYKAKEREIQVASKYHPTLVVANRDLLHRIMLNFADNALHYAEPGHPVELRAGTSAHRTQVRLSVRDYGPSIPSRTWERLEKNLGTSAQTLHMRPQSSGLGLYVAGQFARAMQGKIGATRHRDGVTFFVDMNASTQLSLL